MTRKDFRLIAEVFEAYSFTDEQDRTNLAGRMANALRTTNSNFHRETFMAACGVK